MRGILPNDLASLPDTVVVVGRHLVAVGSSVGPVPSVTSSLSDYEVDDGDVAHGVNVAATHARLPPLSSISLTSHVTSVGCMGSGAGVGAVVYE